jgi:hypothetical protein
MLGTELMIDHSYASALFAARGFMEVAKPLQARTVGVVEAGGGSDQWTNGYVIEVKGNLNGKTVNDQFYVDVVHDGATHLVTAYVKNARKLLAHVPSDAASASYKIDTMLGRLDKSRRVVPKPLRPVMEDALKNLYKKATAEHRLRVA